MVALPLAPGVAVGRLTLLDCKVANGRSTWRCMCSCGKEHFARASNLNSGNTLSCGCLKDELSEGRRLKQNAHAHNATDEDRKSYYLWLWHHEESLYDDDDSRDVYGLIRRDLSFANLFEDGLDPADYKDEGDGSSTTRWAYGYAAD